MDRNENGHPTNKRNWKRIIKRASLVTLCALIVAALLTFIFLNPIVKHLIEENDVKYIGRELEIADLNISLIKGTIEISNLKLYESNGKDIFTSVRGVYAEMVPLELFTKNLIIKEVGIDQLAVNISHEYRNFNFDDLIEKFLPDENPAHSDTAEVEFDWEWTIQNIHADSCSINYQNVVLDSRLTIDQFNVSSPIVSSSNDTLSMVADLAFHNKGKIAANVYADFGIQRYDLNLIMDTVQVAYLYKYLDDYLDISDFGGSISCNLNANGHIKNYNDVIVSGDVSIEELKIIDTQDDTVLYLGRGLIDIEKADHNTDFYTVNYIILEEPYLHVEMYPDGDNLTRLIKYESAVSDSLTSDRASLPGHEYFNIFIYLADYARLIVDEYSKSNYLIDSIGLHGGRINFADHTLNQDAHFLFDNLHMTASNFNTESDRVTFSMRSDINRVGRFNALWAFDPKDIFEMELDIEMTDFLVAFMSPYTFFHTAHPFTNGSAYYKGSVYIHDHKIESKNKIFIENIQVGRKGFADPPIKLPVRLAVSLLRDLDGNIELEIPVSGDLDDPKFSYWPVVLKVLSNTLKKLVTAPFRLFASMFKVNEEDLKQVNWTFGQFELENQQIKQFKSISKVLEAKPQFSLTYTPLENREKEKNYLAVFLSKEDFYRQEVILDPNHIFSSADTIAIATISNQDSAFIQFLRSNHPTEDKLIATSDFARLYIGEDHIANEVENRIALRDTLFSNHLTRVYQIAPARIVLVRPDSLVNFPDTFNLAGPKYLLGFKLNNTEFETEIEPTQEQSKAKD